MENFEELPGSRIKQVRESLGQSQTSFASILNVKQSFLSAVERGVRKAPKSWNVVLNKEYGVSYEYIERGIITNEDRWYVVPQKGTPDGTPFEKMHKRGTTLKLTKTSRIRGVKAENEALTPEEEVRRAEINQWYNRRITESRLYKRHPEAESEGMKEAFAASTIGSDSDRIVRYLHDATHARVDEVLDQVASEAISMSEAVEQIKAITAPLNAIKDHFTAIEAAIVNMTAAAIERFPDVVDVVGYHVREAIADAAERKVERERKQLKSRS